EVRSWSHGGSIAEQNTNFRLKAGLRALRVLLLRHSDDKDMKDSPVRTAVREPSAISRTFAFWLSLTLLIIVPLAFSRSAYRTFTLPKFLVLFIGSAGLIPLLVPNAVSIRLQDLRQPHIRHVLLVSAYVAVIAISTIFGSLPYASLFGTFDNLMGLV